MNRNEKNGDRIVRSQESGVLFTPNLRTLNSALKNLNQMKKQTALFSLPEIDRWYFEETALNSGYEISAGLDEAGRGPLAGPVVAAAVILPFNKQLFTEVTDSKKLSALNREKQFKIIKENAISIGVGISEVFEIDELNILNASLLAMKRAVVKLKIKPNILFIDGNRLIDSNIPQKAIVKGDFRSVSVAAASIVAKVTRDKIMEDLHNKYPQYNFKKHKGYPTKEHIEAIKNHGVLKIHRMSFAPVRDYGLKKGDGE